MKTDTENLSMFDSMSNLKVVSLLKQEIFNAINRYNNPELVYKFQNLCGVRKCNDNKNTFEVKNNFFYYLFNLCSIFGEELFAIFYFTLLLNIFDPFVGRRVLFFWTFAMVIGELMKDFFQMDRPKTPPVIKMETRYSLQYGMPSTHAIGATAHSLGLIFNQRWKVNMTLSLIVACTWIVLIALSRIYKGVHSVADILVGIIITLMQVACLYPIIDKIDHYLISSWSGISILILTSIWIIVFYPHPPTWNSSRSECFIFLGSLIGVNLGTRIDYWWLVSEENFLYYDVNWTTKFMRVLVILTVVALLKITLKPVLLFAIKTIFQVPVESKEHRQHYFFESFYYPVMYAMIGVAISGILPRIYCSVGLGRLYPY